MVPFAIATASSASSKRIAAQHRAEDLFLRDLHSRLHIGEDGRLDEEALGFGALRIALAAA